MAASSYITQTQIAPHTLAEVPLFHGLSPEQLLWPSEHLHYKTFPADTNLITAETPGEVVYIILRGTVKIHIEQVNGTDVVLAILGSGIRWGK